MKSSEQGFAPAQYIRAERARTGWGGPKDLIEAAGDYMDAARQHQADALPYAALIDASGEIVRQRDPELARLAEFMKLLYKSNENNDGEAAHKLGDFYASGRNPNVPQNYKQACYWFTRSQNMGYAPAAADCEMVRHKITAEQFDAIQGIANNHTPPNSGRK